MSFVYAVQYLEDGPGVADITPAAARARLREACERLPISLVLLGWNLPAPVVEACREEATRVGAALYRWHPLLTGDGEFMPRPEWHTIGLQGEPVPGFQGMPEFTFVCPNRPAVRQAVQEHLARLLQNSPYDGFFLDRIRLPSPAANPGRWLACFCADCQRTAEAEGFDLADTRRRIQRLLTSTTGARSFLNGLMGSPVPAASDPALAALPTFLDFRARSVTRFIHTVAEQIHSHGLAVGLDCFSPALTRLVGQNLTALERCAEWTKVMSYCHTLGPAGLPFELLALADWLVDQRQVEEAEALTWLAQATGLPLPANRAMLRTQGLPPAALTVEMARGRTAGIKTLYAGIELVELEGVAELHPAQIEADLRALGGNTDGLALSWDLWHIPLERLDLVRSVMSPLIPRP